MRLLFIRHGDPDYEADGLTETGRREAELLAERIAPMDISEYFVSTMGRAKATAAPTLEKAGRTAKECDWLQEFSIAVHRPDKEGGLSQVPWDWLPQDWLQFPALLDRDQWHSHPVFAEMDLRREHGLNDQFRKVEICSLLGAVLLRGSPACIQHVPYKSAEAICFISYCSEILYTVLFRNGAVEQSVCKSANCGHRSAQFV